MAMFPEAKIVERCAFCSFVATGPLEDVRRAFERHQCDRPLPTVSKRRAAGSNWGSLARARGAA
jgi:hypothetical protein